MDNIQNLQALWAARSQFEHTQDQLKLWSSHLRHFTLGKKLSRVGVGVAIVLIALGALFDLNEASAILIRVGVFALGIGLSAMWFIHKHENTLVGWWPVLPANKYFDLRQALEARYKQDRAFGELGKEISQALENERKHNWQYKAAFWEKLEEALKSTTVPSTTNKDTHGQH